MNKRKRSQKENHTEKEQRLESNHLQNEKKPKEQKTFPTPGFYRSEKRPPNPGQKGHGGYNVVQVQEGKHRPREFVNQCPPKDANGRTPSFLWRM
jgi:hypothetical protein